MARNKALLYLAVVPVVIGGVALFAQAPIIDIDKNRHGNLWAAQKAMAAVYDKIGLAQGNDKSRFGGHAEKARELLSQASRELQLAAESADKR